jgi:hypothetical protein
MSEAPAGVARQEDVASDLTHCARNVVLAALGNQVFVDHLSPSWR